mmetsp:Transcript_5656/g.10086  ORF Transcript_5656/g.10086 Transcript_5656/m.10086 type:complete len:333 (+) Transcript_5656:30-1028(+)
MAGNSLRCHWRHLVGGPAARSSHSVTALGSQIFVFGGEDKPRNAFDASLYSLGSLGAWKTLPPAPTGALLGHGAAALDGRLFVFGGRTGGPNDFGGSGASGETGNLAIFDEKNEAWLQQSSDVEPWPEPRSFHAMCADDKSIYMFGGCGASGRLNDLWELDVVSGNWHCLHSGGAGAPPPRGGASLVTGPDRLVLIFGFDGTQRGDLAIFDLRKQSWELLPQEAQSGQVPSPRSVFCAAELRCSALPPTALIFGGEKTASDLGHAGAGTFNNDLFALDTAELIWSKLEPGPGPGSRGWADLACPAGEARAVLFGGLDDSNTRLGDAWELVFE